MRTWPKKTATLLAGVGLCGIPAAPALHAQQVTFKPYIQPGDAGAFGPTDQMVIAWQTDETTPNPGGYTVMFGKTLLEGSTATPQGRVVDNYLTVDPQFNSLLSPSNPNGIKTAYGAHTDYYALLTGLAYNTTYYYTVYGMGLPAGGFSASFHTRKTGNVFSFEVQGDEGYYPGVPNSNPARIVDYEARIIHEMWDVSQLAIPNAPTLPTPDLALNTGDNVYVTACDSNYRDVWFKTWNSDTDSNDLGAPFIRYIPFYVVDGNHDVGSTGFSANLLADNPPTVPGTSGPGPYGGGLAGGDAMAHFNNFYFPLNGPTGVDIQYQFIGDSATPTGFYFTFNGVTYSSPTAIDALRASTLVNTGQGPKRQIDHESNYSFDYGNVHFVFLDANPHVFSVPSNPTPGSPPGIAPIFPFPNYPSILRQWLINDLDGSKQPWKVVVYHQPAFSSGNATVGNDQMRRVVKFLEDHGVNMVFNGHEHNYQRTYPIRATGGVTQAPTRATPPVVAIDTKFDGVTDTVPDGVIHLVEGAGGNRDFDDNFPNPRGSSLGIDQDDAATGTFTSTVNGLSYNFVNGPGSWLDTNLTDDAMKAYVPGAGTGPKITAKFKAKVFSFADIVVSNNSLTLYQITEPLGTTSSGKYGTDVNGNPLNDPLPDTVIDPSTGSVVSAPLPAGQPALLDAFTVTKPDMTSTLAAQLVAPPAALAGGALVYTVGITNNSPYGLNGVQAIVTLPTGVSFAGPLGDVTTVQGQDVVATLGRLAPGQQRYVQIKGRVATGTPVGTVLAGAAIVRSSTASSVMANTTSTKVVKAGPPPVFH